MKADENVCVYAPSGAHLHKCSNKIVTYIARLVLHSLGKAFHHKADIIGILTLRDTTVSHSHSII